MIQNSGRMAPLLELIKLKEKYRFRLLVDESNSIGVLGKTGRGITEHFEVPVSFNLLTQMIPTAEVIDAS